MARALSKPATTVQRWLEAGYIRPKHHSDILSAALREQVRLDVSDFVNVDFQHPAFLPLEKRASALNTPSSGSTGVHADAASTHPTADIGRSPDAGSGPTLDLERVS